MLDILPCGGIIKLDELTMKGRMELKAYYLYGIKKFSIMTVM